MNFNSPKTNLNFHIINKNNIYQHPKSKLQSDNLTSTKIASRNIIYTNMKKSNINNRSKSKNVSNSYKKICLVNKKKYIH